MQKIPQFKTIDEYLANQRTEHQEKLETIRHTIKTAVPEANEAISYQMPAFKYHGMLCFFAVFKDHYSLFVSPEIREAFNRELQNYTTTKSAIHFPLAAPLPVKLIDEIVRFAAIKNFEKKEQKNLRKRK